MSGLRIKHVARKAARAFVAAHHSHHAAHLGELFALGAYTTEGLVAVVVAGRPVAPSLDDSETWEVTRLCCGPSAPKYCASRLLGAIGRVAAAAGVDRLISYTRADEPGTYYLASNFAPCALVAGRAHTTGNRSQRWLPGMYVPSSEVVDRVRWERGRAAAPRGAIVWDGSRWT